MRQGGGVLSGAVGKSIPSTFGLCGGMSLAAADFYLAGLQPPDAKTPPVQGSALYEYLYERQVESLGPGGVMAVAFHTWMGLPDEGAGGTAERTAAELPAIVSRLECGELVPLGLVFVRHASNREAPLSPAGKLWNNHQVLAYGVERRSESLVDVLIYDPNFPGDDRVVVRFTNDDANGSVWGNRITGRGRVTRIRGVFPMPYKPPRAPLPG